MADDKTTRGAADSARGDLQEDDGLRYWTDKFGRSAEELKSAAEALGVSAEAAGKHLKFKPSA